MKKKRTAKSPLTVDEIIERRVERLKMMNFVSAALDPPAREIAIGDEVEVGNLRECTVVALRDGGRVCVLRHRPIQNLQRLTGETDTDWDYGAWYWWDVMPRRSQARCLQFARKSDRHNSCNTSLGALITHACEKEYCDNPDYQRGYAWTADDRLRFIDSLMQGINPGLFVFVTYDWPEVRTEILDGKQRLSTIADFVLGKFTYRGFRWWELNPADRDEIEQRDVQYIKLDGSRTKRSDRLRLFLEVNAAGVPQTEKHIAYVRELYEDELRKEARDR